MNASLACEQCQTLCTADSIAYSNRGDRLCQACHASTQIADGDELAVRSQRSARRNMLTGLGVIVAIPVLLIATGNGGLLVTAFTVLAVLSGILSYRMFRSYFFTLVRSSPEPHIKTTALICGGAGIVLGVLAYVSNMIFG